MKEIRVNSSNMPNIDVIFYKFRIYESGFF